MSKDDPSQRAPLMLAVILGGLCAIGPLAIDMYMPGFPQMATDFSVESGAIQFSLTTFFTGLMFGQLLCGPLSDKYGRKPLIFGGLGLFALSAFGCAAAPDAASLYTFRFFQGLGGSIGMVMAFAVTRDLYTGLAAAKLLSLIVMLVSVAPIIAPVLGSMVVKFGSWRIIFCLLGLFGGALIGLTAWKLPETRSPDLRRSGKLTDGLVHYGTLLRSRRFLPLVLVSSAVQGGMFAYLAASSSVYMTTLGLSPLQYSMAFGLNAFGLMIAAKLAPVLIRRFQAQRLLWAMLLIDLVAGLLLTILTLTGHLSLAPVAAMLFTIVAANGIIMPLTSMMALDSFGHISGTAAALMGAIRFAAGAVASGATAAFSDGTPLSMSVVMAVCSFSAIVIAATTLPRQDEEAIVEKVELSTEESA
ncbi:multidrug effflux MFS transporter [Blastopirellula retiformator]|uniref:Bicyclomycin resistance protein n=1 Tax=Blastopirellula retiformator TaxID=2527970 RepID=A0A5C5UUQ4_9BACT|nr:multidrug effflux MFS transporter [Blastopirellula retiformator]TWT29858.1 Bicyclomycin resistance protein [Blastopirellula retiformator]